MRHDVANILRLARVRALYATGEAAHIREAAGLLRAEFAHAIDVAHVTVSRWEHGERTPTGAAALRALDLLEALQRQAMAA